MWSPNSVFKLAIWCQNRLLQVSCKNHLWHIVYKKNVFPNRKPFIPVWKAPRHSSVRSCLWGWCVAPRPLCFARSCASLSATSRDPVSSSRPRRCCSRSPEGAGPRVCYGPGLTGQDVRGPRKRETLLDLVSFWTAHDYRQPVAENEGLVWQLWQIPEQVRLVHSRRIQNLSRRVGESPGERRCEGTRQPKWPLTTE